MGKFKHWWMMSSAFACIALAGFALHGMDTAPRADKTIVKTYKYIATSETVFPEALADSLEADGKQYVLSRNYQAETKLSVESKETRHAETVTITGLPSMQAPETKDFMVGGKKVTLILQSADYTPVQRTYDAKGTVEYPNQTEKPNAPEESDIIYISSDGDEITVPGKLVSIRQVQGDGKVSELASSISMPKNAKVFTIAEKQVEYNEETPCWDGYQEDIRILAGLPEGSTVTGGIWDGEAYEEDGMTKRNVIWYVQSPRTGWEALYEANGTITTYSAKAVYGASTEALGLSGDDANETRYTLLAEIPYEEKQSVEFDEARKRICGNVGVIATGLALISFAVFVRKQFLEREEEDRAEEN